MFGGLFSFVNETARSTSIDWKSILIGATVAQTSFNLVANVLEYRVQQRPSPPKELSKELNVDLETFKKAQNYSKAKLRVSCFERIYDCVLNCAAVHYNVLPKLWYFWAKHVQGDIKRGILTTLTSGFFSSLLSIPFSLYSTFVVEEEFGFNKMTLKLFIVDTVKSWILGAVFMPPILAGMQKIIEYSQDMFVPYLLGFLLFVSVVAMFLVPVVIMPWFSTYTPLEEGELRTKIEALASKLNFPLKRLYVEDGSTRSAHSNAYFVGLPWYKQIVIYDTLIKDQTVDETVAVVAHELGHWKHNHMSVLLSVQLVSNAINFGLLAPFLGNQHFFQSLGFKNQDAPILMALLAYSDAITPVNIAIKFAANLITRTCEYDADRFAVRLGHGQDLAPSLRKLVSSNLSTVEQHPFYSTFHNSHPKMGERLSAVKEEMKKLE